MQELSKQYRPAEHEERIFARWIEAGAFHADPGRVVRGEAEPYCVLIPPPNVTDRLHLGHALNNTLQDILVRAHRMMGFETLWMPGTDHAGIATQAVVERRLKKEGILKGPLRQSMQRDEFVAHVQAFKDEYEATITNQLKKMGCSCDWERQRFTMDSVCARAVREAFFRLFRDGLIYRGKRLVNWDPALQTAVADDEVENIEIDGAFYYLRYPLVHAHGQRTEKEVARGTPAPDDAVPVTWSELARAGFPGANRHDPEEQAWVTVATTRPETYLGDTAVAVNPRDPRAKALRGLNVELPIVGRVIPIIEDDYVVLPSADNAYGKAIGLPERDESEPEDPKAAFATGFLKVTPAHDPNDYELGLRHKLPMINVMAPDASISDKHGWSDARETANAHIFLGKKREDARKLVVKEFEARGLLEDQKPYRHTVGHSDRSKAAIEPYLSDQWYVRVTDPRMAASANAALTPSQRSGAGSGATSAPPGSKILASGYSLEEGRSSLTPSGFSPEPSGYSGKEGRFSPEPSGYSGKEGRFSPEASGYSPEQGRLSPEAGKSSPGASHPAAAARFSDAGDGALSFHPSRYAKTYETWHDNIRDWCISRQLWWGHRIPVWTVTPRQSFGPSHPEEGNAAYEDFGAAIAGASSDLCWTDEPNTMTHWDSIKQTTHVCARDAAAESLLNRVSEWLARGGNPAELEREFKGKALKGAQRFAALATRLERDPDVLDTWFSSALWPMSTMGWPDPHAAAADTGIDDFPALLPAFNPTSTLCTAREIITLWVSRMVMFNRYFRGEETERQGDEETKTDGDTSSLGLCVSSGPVPFRDVYIHCVVQDGQGRKMSKSLGNGVDPLDIIESHGSDAMRFTICQMATQTQDVRLPVKKDPTTGKNTSEKFDLGRNFANKVWNAASFALKALGTGHRALVPDSPTSAQCPVPSALADRWMLSRLAAAVAEVNAALASFEFSGYGQTVYDLFWRDFCDWYLEAIKPTVAEDAGQRAVLAATLDTILRLLHPVMPYVTEAIFEQVRTLDAGAVAGVTLGPSRKGELLATAAWPRVDASLRDEKAEADFEWLRTLITAIREVRAKHNVHPKRRVVLHAPAAAIERIRANEAIVTTLAGLAQATERPPAAGVAAVEMACGGVEYQLSDLADAVDAGAEKARLTKLIADLEKSVATFESRLANPGYAAKAPPAMVQQTKDQLEKAKAELAAAKKALEALA